MDELLGVNSSALLSVPLPQRFHVFLKQTGEKERTIETPVGLNKAFDMRMQKLLSKIVTPAFLKSKKGSSIRHNAEAHLEDDYFLMVDIESFYQSTKIEYVKDFFRLRLKMSGTIANRLAAMLCVNGHIPTGSSVSQLLAYFAYAEMFERIASLCSRQGVCFTLYVDDMAFSSPRPLPGSLLNQIRRELRRWELRLKTSKIRYKKRAEAKRITGCIINSTGNLKIPNRNLRKIISILRSGPIAGLDEPELSTLIGCIAQAQQLEPGKFEQSRRHALYYQRILRRQEWG